MTHPTPKTATVFYRDHLSDPEGPPMTTPTTPEGRRELKALAEMALYGDPADVEPWICIGCGADSPRKIRPCDCPSQLVFIRSDIRRHAEWRHDPSAPIEVAPATVLSLLAALEEAEGREAEQTKAFDLLVSTVLAARTTNTRAYMEGLADDLNVALAAFGDPDRVAFERGSFSIIRATTKSGEASE